MKKFVIIFMFIASLSFLVDRAFAQIGSSCAAAHVVATLPFSLTGLSTSSSGNNITTSPCPSTNYLGGNDYLFTYAPLTDEVINITLANTGTMVGLFVVQNCPTDTNAVCVTSTTSLGGNPSLVNVSLTGGNTYYIIISTLTFFSQNLTTNFDINIEKLNPFDAGLTAITSPVSGCGLGTEQIQISITNYGIDTISNFPVSYQLNAGTAIVETVTDTLIPNQTKVFTFAQTADFSALGTYTIKAWTSLSADPVATNDTVNTTISSVPVVSNFPYVNGFETGADYWTVGGINPSWELGTPADSIINYAAIGTNAWKTNLNGNANTGENSFVYSPCFDFTSLVLPIIDLRIWSQNTGTGAATRLESSIDSGTTWQRVGAFGDLLWYNSANGWTGNDTMWNFSKHTLDGLGGKTNVRLRIRFIAPTNGAVGEGFAFDNISIYDSPAKDLAIVEMITPLSSCGLTTSEQVKIAFKNVGTVAQNNFSVSYKVVGSTPVIETVSDTIAPNDTMQYTFTTPIDLSVVNSYDIVIKTLLIADANPLNDFDTIIVQSLPLIATYPYFNDFESGAGSWTAGGTASSWALGTPTDSIINHAASGTHAWKTNLTGDYNSNENSYVTSPCLNFSTLTLPVIELKYWSENVQQFFATSGALIESSVDGGNTWVTVGASGDPDNWYANTYGWNGASAGWITAKHKMNTLAGLSNVKLRVHFTSAIFGGATEGFAFDDVKIYDSPANDLGVSAVLAPISTCGLSATEHVVVRIKNYGTQAQHGFDVNLKLNNGNILTETAVDTITPGDSLTYTFIGISDFGTAGTYNVVAFTSLVTDQDLTNDTAIAIIDNMPIVATFPYDINFENGSGGWHSGGASNSWALGTPAGTVINHASSGLNCWKTNLNGNSNTDEDSYVEGPCYDFTTLNNPVIKIKIWHLNTSQLGGVTLEHSIDGGVSWLAVGANADPFNWYNGTFSTGWVADANTSTDWLTASHQLNNLAGQASVKLRIRFTSGLLGTSGEGFAFDDINIDNCLTLPTANFSVANINGGTVTFQNLSTNATAYSWNFGEILPSTDTTANPTHTFLTNGTYAVTLTASSECGSTTYVDSVTVIAVGVSELAKENNISCFPNPTTNNVNIVVNAPVAQKMSITIKDLKGSILISEKLKTVVGINKKSLDVSILSKGIYFVTIVSEKQNSTTKLIIE